MRAIEITQHEEMKRKNITSEVTECSGTIEQNRLGENLALKETLIVTIIDSRALKHETNFCALVI